MSLTRYVARRVEIPSCDDLTGMICGVAVQLEDGTISAAGGEALIHAFLAAWVGAKMVAKDSEEEPALVSCEEAERAYSVAYRRAYERVWNGRRPAGITDESVADEYPDWLPWGNDVAVPTSPIVALAQLLGTLQAEDDNALLREGQRRATEVV
jgi:hypothetical protein